jgi:predicted Zn-dependent peptidase
MFRESFAEIERAPKDVSIRSHSPLKAEVETVSEEYDVNQCKAVLNFKTDSDDRYALKMVSIILGELPFSKLFLNVREKLSLCYYAHSVLEKHKGIITVSSGIAPENLKKAEKEIFIQLDDIKKGNITPQELESVETEIVTALRTSMDDPYRMENYWLDNSLLGLTIAPDELAALVSGVTIEDVVAASQEVKADCLYFLTGKENENDA